MEHDLRERLDAYVELLLAYAPKLDLVSSRDASRDLLWERHVRDSLRALPLFEELSGPFADVGAGAGLPGIPLALATGKTWRLIEPRRRRAAFLEEAVRTLELDCEVVAATAEQAAEAGCGRAHEAASARALAPPARALELVAPLVQDGGKVVLFVGESTEIPAKAAWELPGIATVTVTWND